MFTSSKRTHRISRLRQRAVMGSGDREVRWRSTFALVAPRIACLLYSMHRRVEDMVRNNFGPRWRLWRFETFRLGQGFEYHKGWSGEVADVSCGGIWGDIRFRVGCRIASPSLSHPIFFLQVSDLSTSFIASHSQSARRGCCPFRFLTQNSASDSWKHFAGTTSHLPRSFYIPPFNFTKQAEVTAAMVLLFVTHRVC